MRDRVYLIDEAELELMKDCRSITYALIDLFDSGDIDRLFSLVEDCGTDNHLETLKAIRESVFSKFHLRNDNE